MRAAAVLAAVVLVIVVLVAVALLAARDSSAGEGTVDGGHGEPSGALRGSTDSDGGDSIVGEGNAVGGGSSVAPRGSADSDGVHGRFVLHKRFDFDGSPEDEFEVVEHSDEFLTHSCSNYANDGSTVFTKNGHLHLRVDKMCEGGKCMNSGRVMSKDSFKYGLFTFTAKVPKCNYVWPAIWLLPGDYRGGGTYGTWPCSGEIDVLETVHDQPVGTFNLVAGYGSEGGCWPETEMACNKCQPGYCTSTTMDWRTEFDRYFVEAVDCDAEHPSWEEHTFVLNWQPDQLTTWVDPTLKYDEDGHLVQIIPKQSPRESNGLPTWRTYRRQTTPTWLAVQKFMKTCFKEESHNDAPFDDGFKIVLNIAVGGYGGAPCMWGSETCGSSCGGAVGSEMILSDISVWKWAA